MAESSDHKGTGSFGFRVLTVGMAAIGPFSLNIFKPCLPFIKADFDAPIEVVQLGLSLGVLAAAVATAVSGPLVDRLGRKPIILATAWLYLLSSVLGAAAPNVEVLIVARIVQAATSSVAMTVIRTVVHDVHPNAERVIARVTLGAVAAVLLAPALGGLLIDQLGWRAVFALTAVVGVGLLIPVHFSLGETLFTNRERAPLEGTLGSQLRRLVTAPVFLGYAVQSALHFAIFFAFTSASTYLMVDLLGRAAYEYGAWFVFMGLFVAAGLGTAERLSSGSKAGGVAFIGSCFVLVGSLASAWVLSSPTTELTPAILFFPASVAGFGVGLALPSTNAGVMEIAPEIAGTASGMLGFSQLLVAAIFAQLVVRDEPRTAQVLAELLVVGGVGAFAFSLLSARHTITRSP